jgi:putative ABC transport system permease protein
MDRLVVNVPTRRTSLLDPWLWRMAWRDSRRSRSRLFLFMSAIVLGIAALVAIHSFGDNLARSVDGQAQELLGADAVLNWGWGKTYSSRTNALRDSLRLAARDFSRETAFASMVASPKTGGVRLAQVKAVRGGFPYYGTWDVRPLTSVPAFRGANGTPRPVALVDDALLTQLGARVGDSVQVGKLRFRVLGRVLKTPGQTAVTTTVAPTVFIPDTLLASTGLLLPGSRATERLYLQFGRNTDVEATMDRVEERLDKAGIGLDTVARRKQQTGRVFADLTSYLGLVAFVALLLGCVGVASSVHLYVKEKVASVAVLRCLGASGRQALYIYLIQTALMGLLGAVVGTALGTAVQWLLPEVFGGFLPVEVDVALSGRAILQGVGTGLVIAVLFALLPLLTVRNISPLRTLRASFEESAPARDPLRWLLFALIAGFIGGFAYWLTRSGRLALGFTTGLVVTFAVLAGVGQLLILLVRRFFPASWSYVWRQSLANLYRPRNQTLVLVTTIGLGTFLIATLYLSQQLLLSRVARSASGAQPNMVLFDIQNEQKDGVRALVEKQGLPVLQQVPVVTMHLSEINGRTVEEIQKDSTAQIPDWALTREYRVTYRDSLIESEKLVAGIPPTPDETTPRISVEEAYLKRLKLNLGDTLVFDVQGAQVPTVVGGTREVDWNRVQTNFLLVFPSGVLERAPQFQVLMTRVPDAQRSAALQRELLAQFPNVSSIDLGLILSTLDDILDKIAFVIRFMALFSIATGLLVLGSSIVISKYQRIQESVLLRTLGASRRQILAISALEYVLLGLLAALTGILLSLGSTWALAEWVFKIPYAASPVPLLAVAGLVTVVTLLIGLFNSRDVVTRPPLDVLRAEA